ncbi:MAG TPA: hypothetical protein VGZ00_05760 [Candidatus Baltobacteraceae bacterium]|jgi:hypothetical protein|nr:hypothetical protein [Candidatus Baltobacteraceae bacterium]
MTEQPKGRRSIIKTDGPGLEMQRRRRRVTIAAAVFVILLLGLVWFVLHGGELLPVTKG